MYDLMHYALLSSRSHSHMALHWARTIRNNHVKGISASVVLVLKQPVKYGGDAKSRSTFKPEITFACSELQLGVSPGLTLRRRLKSGTASVHKRQQLAWRYKQPLFISTRLVISVSGADTFTSYSRALACSKDVSSADERYCVADSRTVDVDA